MIQINDLNNTALAATHGRGLFYGIFNAFDVILGDINNDNILNVLDIVLLVNLILENYEYNGTADINNDNELNVLDVVLLVNIILDI